VGCSAYVRHPGYVGAIGFELATPILLGSVWALLPGALSALLMIVRTALEIAPCRPNSPAMLTTPGACLIGCCPAFGDLLFSIITLIAIALLGWLLQAFDWQSPLFAFLVNWLVMSWIATSSEVIQIAFAPGYYAIQPFEQSGRLYERLGIRVFKRLVRCGPLAFEKGSAKIRFSFQPQFSWREEQSSKGNEHI